MIQSMTGYGRAEYALAKHKTIVEIKSLNSKQLDLTIKASPLFHVYESEIRRMLVPVLQRGKVEVSVYTASLTASEEPTNIYPAVNEEAFRYYYHQLRNLQTELQAPEEQLFAALLRIPEVLKAGGDETISAEEWELLSRAIEEAAKAFTAFRVQEGNALEAMFADKLNGIERLLSEVEPLEKGRVEKIRQRLEQQLVQLSAETLQPVDRNRLEAELIYYLEKLDITEEKVRLSNHIAYFRRTMTEGSESGVGKKLGFIAQEMGREINTLGSKANQSEMQIIVVKMKDLLEQIKEQVLNVL
ncbi:MAG: YicC family protein [Paludibacteraceae bacterium]|nr:YicC family protein [Paludibacteraceae bacterium]